MRTFCFCTYAGSNSRILLWVNLCALCLSSWSLSCCASTEALKWNPLDIIWMFEGFSQSQVFLFINALMRETSLVIQ